MRLTMSDREIEDEPYWMNESGYEQFPSQRRYRRAMYAAEKLGESRLFGGHTYEGEHVGKDMETYCIRIEVEDNPLDRFFDIGPMLTVYSNDEEVYREVALDGDENIVHVDRSSEPETGIEPWEHILDCLYHRAREEEREERRRRGDAGSAVMPGPLGGMLFVSSRE